jgi:glucokinase
MAVIGLDLGGTKLSGAIFGTGGKIIKKEVWPLEKRGGNDAGDFILKMTHSLIGIAAGMSLNIDAVGCCVPGIAYHGTGRVWAPNISGWEDYPLLDKLKAGISDPGISVIIDNDRACAILGEVWQGSAKNCRDVIFLAIGTGIGAGIMAGGSIIRGADDIAGSIGWMALDKPYRKKYSGIGCFEYHAAGEGLVRVALELIEKDPEYTGLMRDTYPGNLTARHIFEAYHSGDALAVAVLRQAVEFWGMAVANLVSLFNPEKIIFGGGIFGPAAVFLDDIMTEAAKWAQPVSIRKVKTDLSSLGSDAGLYGAASLGIKGQTP